MKIILSGVETTNKGAELMLYAILQEIERKWPEATVYIPYSRCKQGLDYVKTTLHLKFIPFSRFIYKTHLDGILERLHLLLDWFNPNIVKGADWFIDGSGFAFSDQFRINKHSTGKWHATLKGLYHDGCKVVFLPQAFGPIERPATKEMIRLIGKYASVVMPREQVSYEYLEKSGLIDMKKVTKHTDFTSLVEGTFPIGYEHLKNGVCVIPNTQMIAKGIISYDDYISLLKSIIQEAGDSGYKVYLLNHAGKKDEQLANQCKESIGNDIEVVSGLNALEVKGLIASAYLVITSRFHGLASALNSCVPPLSTSWSHKYTELYKDYGLDSLVLPLDNTLIATKMLHEMLNKEINQKLRTHLTLQKQQVKEQTQSMWQTVWNLSKH